MALIRASKLVACIGDSSLAAKQLPTTKSSEPSITKRNNKDAFFMVILFYQN
jgi:hypothetical protein